MPQADSKSSSGQEQQQTAQTAPYPTPYPQQFEDDTIDLYELWITLWNWKWLVIAVTVVVALGSVVYALQLQHVYKAEALLLPPKAKDIQSMNIFSLSIDRRTLEERKNDPLVSVKNEHNSASVYNQFKQNLKSRIIQKKFIQENGLMELLAPERTRETRDLEIYSGFAGLIKLGGDVNGITSLSIEMHDAEIAAQWVNGFIEFVDKETISLLVEDLQNSIANRVLDIEYNIESKRIMAEKRREDQIIRYTEHAQIAKNLGMFGRVDATNIIQNTQMNVDIATATTPLYYLGYEALMTEINILHNRKSDDPFITGLRDLEEQLTKLRSIKINKEKLRSVHVDQAAYSSNSPIKPNRRLIVSLATVIGLISGIFLALFIEFVQNQKKKHPE